MLGEQLNNLVTLRGLRLLWEAQSEEPVTIEFSKMRDPKVLDQLEYRTPAWKCVEAELSSVPCLNNDKTQFDDIFLFHPVAIGVGALQMTNLLFGCVHHAANFKLRRLAEPIPLQAWPPVFHIKAEASR